MFWAVFSKTYFLSFHTLRKHISATEQASVAQYSAKGSSSDFTPYFHATSNSKLEVRPKWSLFANPLTHTQYHMTVLLVGAVSSLTSQLPSIYVVADVFVRFHHVADMRTALISFLAQTPRRQCTALSCPHIV